MGDWISVDDSLPKIPKNKAGIVCDIWVTFNLNGKGSRVADAAYEYTTFDEPVFHGNGNACLTEFTVTHYSIIEPPK